MKFMLDAGDTVKIVGHALHDLGLDFEYLKAKARLPQSSLEELTVFNVASDEWCRICEALFIPIDSVTFGYSQRAMQHRLHELASLNRTIPMTKKVASILWAYRENETLSFSQSRPL